MGTSQAHKAETRLKASGLLGEVLEQFLVHCKDALQGMCCYIIILIVSVSKILLMVTIYEFALCLFVLLCCWATITASRRLGFQIRIEAIKWLASDLRSSYHNPFQCYDQHDGF